MIKPYQQAMIDIISVALLGVAIFGMEKWLGLSPVEAIGIIVIVGMWKSYEELKKIRESLADMRKSYEMLIRIRERLTDILNRSQR